MKRGEDNSRELSTHTLTLYSGEASDTKSQSQSISSAKPVCTPSAMGQQSTNLSSLHPHGTTPSRYGAGTPQHVMFSLLEHVQTGAPRCMD
ncbi:hypothetical protein BASA61_003297 [Batrachochytrium salamandrivorans]|nr:hypothetical protein BASA61_003297 [Batrachochytrium salamandrivorans]